MPTIEMTKDEWERYLRLPDEEGKAWELWREVALRLNIDLAPEKEVIRISRMMKKPGVFYYQYEDKMISKTFRPRKINF